MKKKKKGKGRVTRTPPTTKMIMKEKEEGVDNEDRQKNEEIKERPQGKTKNTWGKERRAGWAYMYTPPCLGKGKIDRVESVVMKCTQTKTYKDSKSSVHVYFCT